jgi:hypothetical protein
MYCRPRLESEQLSLGWSENGKRSRCHSYVTLSIEWHLVAESSRILIIWFMVLSRILGWAKKLECFLSFGQRSSQFSVGDFLLRTGKFTVHQKSSAILNFL